MTELKKQVGQRIKEARNQKGITQREFGKMLGVSHTTVNGYETGKQNLTLDTLEKVAAALGMAPKSFL
ncbi:helix-turn-helix domain-containing protein [Spirosoma linguale]|uniref:Transcriptional regulator, XRE family n=1 Tax=Spirosoma linguale (strain ATCC 33905 / DSM 74 / LMG 10896 / Claus 1) TaxID=504472 RepID=D2QNB2_SPILD|nr:transcriptional regulator, XRE family [Spirosoma linguale DSM 74]